MTNTTLELTETTGDFPVAQETPCLLAPETATQTETAAALASRKSWKSRLAAWLLPPVCVCAIFLLVKVVMVAGDLFTILNTLYANMPT